MMSYCQIKKIINSIYLVKLISFNFLFPLLVIAQKPTVTNQNLALGKARIVFIYSSYEDAAINNMLVRVPFFINDTLVCRMTNNHYSIHDIDVGTYKLSVKNAGKKMGKKAITETITLNPGEIVYYRFFNEVGFLKSEFYFVQLTNKTAEKYLDFLEEELKCIQTITLNPPIITNKKFYIVFQGGFSNYASDYRNWNSRFQEPLVTTLNNFTIGGELGLRIGTNNHYIGFELYANKQPPVEITPPFPNGEQRFIVLHQIGFFYRHLFKLDKKNKVIITPKVGLGVVNIVEKTNNPNILDKTLEANSGLSFSLGLVPEFRVTKNVSIAISADYINGTINAAKRDNINLTSFRLLMGVKYQFNN